MNAEAEAYPRSSAVCVTPSPPPNSSIALKRRKRRRQPACSYRRLDRSVGPKFARTCEAPWPNPQARAGRRDRRRALRKRPAMRNCAAKEALNRHVARTPDEVYSVVANLLYINGIVGRDAVMNAQELPQVKVPNADGFPDGRPRGSCPSDAICPMSPAGRSAGSRCETQRARRCDGMRKGRSDLGSAKHGCTLRL
jgi:hypothetical protein